MPPKTRTGAGVKKVRRKEKKRQPRLVVPPRVSSLLHLHRKIVNR